MMMSMMRREGGSCRTKDRNEDSRNLRYLEGELSARSFLRFDPTSCGGSCPVLLFAIETLGGISVGAMPWASTFFEQLEL